MKNYRDSDYAVNKYASGIVYRFADQTVEVTLEDYLCENPGKTEADFAELKALSDEIYLDQIRNENAQSQKTVSFHALEETSCCAVPSAEVLHDKAEIRNCRVELANTVMDKLTDVQRRRYIQHVVEGLSTWDIATQEGSNQKSVYESVLAAEKKMSKFLSNN